MTVPSRPLPSGFISCRGEGLPTWLAAGGSHRARPGPGRRRPRWQPRSQPATSCIEMCRQLSAWPPTQARGTPLGPAWGVKGGRREPACWSGSPVATAFADCPWGVGQKGRVWDPSVHSRVSWTFGGRVHRSPCLRVSQRSAGHQLPESPTGPSAAAGHVPSVKCQDPSVLSVEDSLGFNTYCHRTLLPKGEKNASTSKVKNTT